MKVTYITHSSFMIELDKSILLFDYYKGAIPDADEGKEVYVLSSHSHYDHYNKNVFDHEWGADKVHYILSSDITVNASFLKKRRIIENDNLFFVGPDQDKQIGAIKLHTLKSTDEGVAFCIECEGKNIYHAGDLNWWHWEGEPDAWNKKMEADYKKEIQKIAGKSFDAAFLPLDPRQETVYWYGVDYFIQNINVKHVFPMHFWGDYQITSKIKHEKAAASYQDLIIEISKTGQTWEI